MVNITINTPAIIIITADTFNTNRIPHIIAKKQNKLYITINDIFTHLDKENCVPRNIYSNL